MLNHNHLKLSFLAAAISALGTAPAYALEYESGDFRMQLDTTVSIGAAWRMSDRDYRYVGKQNALAADDNPSGDFHLHETSSGDNGDLNYKKGSTYSEVAKVTMDLEINYLDYGAFVRGKAYYDHRIVNGDGVTDRPAYYPNKSNGFNEEPYQSSGRSADILDAFVWGNWWLGDHPLNVRLGKQVISWGEGVFFQNGINAVNPVDLNALFAPGAELKDALIPLNALYGSLGLTDNLNIEGFYLLEWDKIEATTCGSYFSTSDLAGVDCHAGFWSSGGEPGSPSGFHLPRLDDVQPEDDGQYGLAMRYFAESIGAEFGMYYMNIHARNPYAEFILPDPYALGIPGNLSMSEARDAANISGGVPNAAAGFWSTGGYRIIYPEDIQIIGLSASSNIDFGLPGGETAIASEISYRPDMPMALNGALQIGALAGLPMNACFETGGDCWVDAQPGDALPGIIEADYYQAEIAFTHFFDRLLGASRWTMVLDVAGSYFEKPDSDLYTLAGPYNASLNNPWIASDTLIETGSVGPIPYGDLIASGNLGDPAQPGTFYYEDSYYPTKGAWGYKLRAIGSYNNVFAGINLTPSLAFGHDVSGTSPSSVGNFIEDRKQLGLGLQAEYQNMYSVKVNYVDYFGAEPYNQLADRDYVSLSAQASF